jgi:hypothetical protein
MQRNHAFYLYILNNHSFPSYGLFEPLTISWQGCHCFKGPVIQYWCPRYCCITSSLVARADLNPRWSTPLTDAVVMTSSVHDVLVTYKTIESMAKRKSKNLFDISQAHICVCHPYMTIHTICSININRIISKYPFETVINIW